MRKRSNVCDYFVIASGASTTQVRAIADNIVRRLKEKGQRLWHIEGEREALWTLLDYGDVVAHVFLDRTRRFYDLESLWADAPRTSFEEVGPITAKKARPKGRPKSRKKARKALRAYRPVGPEAIKPSRRVKRKKTRRKGRR
jgi:ribosome-associated protein